METTRAGDCATTRSPQDRSKLCAKLTTERARLDTGVCELRDGSANGVAVRIAERIGATAGQVFVSGTVKDFVAGSSLTFTDRGSHALDGEVGTWHVFQA